MKVLIDENLPLDLRHFLAEHEVFTVAYLGWKGLKNGALLARADAEGFTTVVTRDSGIEHQQNLNNLPVTVIVLPKQAKKLEDLVPLVPALLTAIASTPPKTVFKIA